MIKKLYQLIIDFVLVTLDDLMDFFAAPQSKRAYFMTEKMGRFIQLARNVLWLSKNVAVELNSGEINALHLLVGMTRAESSDAQKTLADFDIVEAKLMPFIKTKTLPQTESMHVENLQLSEDYENVLKLSVDVARTQGSSVITTAHLLMGLMKLESPLIDEMVQHFAVERKVLIKQAEFHLNDQNSYEHTFIRSQSALIRKAYAIEARRKRLSSTLQSFGIGNLNKQDNE